MMITKNKLEIYDNYDGNVDNWDRFGNYDVLDQEEWEIISGLKHDWHIISDGLASKYFILIFEKKLTANFDSADTIAYFKSMKSLW